MFCGVIDAICSAGWQDLDRRELTDVAWAYYYFSVQFRENLELARALLPDDAKLQHLAREEMNTDNLSPWDGVAERGERMNHDEFMRRTLLLSPTEPERRQALERAGEAYLQKVRQVSAESRAVSIASYEDGGLESVFKAFLRASDWNSNTLLAFRHFLTEHIRFDSDEDEGHGALARHLRPDDRILPLWAALRDLLVEAVPALAQPARAVSERGEPEAVAV